VSLLIKAKCKLDPLNIFGETPLLKAVQKGKRNIIDELLTAGCHKDSYKKLKSAQLKHPELVSMFSLDHLVSLWPRAHNGFPPALQQAIEEILCITKNCIVIPKEVRILLVYSTIKIHLRLFCDYEIFQ